MWRRTHTEVVHVETSGKGPTQEHRKLAVNKEMEGWMMRGSLEPSSSGDDEDDESGDEGEPTSEDAASFNSERMHRVSPFSSKRQTVKSRKDNSGPETCHDREK